MTSFLLNIFFFPSGILTVSSSSLQYHQLRQRYQDKSFLIKTVYLVLMFFVCHPTNPDSEAKSLDSASHSV